MGLDMYLFGEHIRGDEVELGYWRKHPDLHGFIVQQFADGVDDCRKIYLSVKDVETILEAVKIEALPFTTGFFFGTSQPEDRFQSIEILEKAIEWLQTEAPHPRKVYYQASW